MGIASKAELAAAAETVHAVFPGTPQYVWPLLSDRLGCEVWVKHENHTPVGAFKIRGGLNFIKDYVDGGGRDGLITATRGNHGQSIATACRRFGAQVTIVVPEGNSREKNDAMRAQGGTLVVHGHDFQASAEFARDKAAAEGLTMLPSFHPLLVRGVGTYAMELFQAAPELDTVYVPIGLGSGICGVMSARDALGLTTKVVGVVSENAAAYALSFEAGKPVATNAADTFADGVACRVPIDMAVDAINAGAERVVTVSESQIKHAMRAYYRDTHNIAEGAGAVPLAALMAERARMQGKKVGVILTGGNIDRELYLSILAEEGGDD